MSHPFFFISLPTQKRGWVTLESNQCSRNLTPAISIVAVRISRPDIRLPCASRYHCESAPPDLPMSPQLNGKQDASDPESTTTSMSTGSACAKAPLNRCTGHKLLAARAASRDSIDSARLGMTLLGSSTAPSLAWLSRSTVLQSQIVQTPSKSVLARS